MHFIEPLESRIAPAVVFVNATTATYDDHDGDHVTVHFTKPILTGGNVATVFNFNAAGDLARLDLTGASSDGTGVAFTVAKVAGGDGLVNVGAIDATGHDLGAVKLPGDLGKILAGDATTTTPGVKSLAVNSLGRLGLDTGASDLKTDIKGPLDTLIVKGDVKDAEFEVQGGKIGSVTIGGSLIGGAVNYSGSLYSNIGIGPVKIGHDLQGGAGAGSGEITTNGSLTSLTIGGSVIGGTNDETGRISGTSIGALKIGGDLLGGSIDGTTGTLDSSGAINCAHHFGSIVIGGDIVSGIDASTGGSLTNNASIAAGDDIGSLTVRGSIIGHDVPTGSSLVEIIARGQAAQGIATDIAIGKISVGGRVENAEILGGYNQSLQPVNADAQIGPVKVGGDWVASNLVAGAKAGLFGFGAGDTKTSGANVTDTAGIFSKIAGITVGGQVLGTPNSFNVFDSFGFVAEQIGAVKVGGHVATLTIGAHNDNRAIGQTPDFHIHEV